MKFYTIILLSIIFLLQYASADWRADIEEERIHKVNSIISKQHQTLMNHAIMHDTPGGWACANSGSSQLINLMTIHTPKVRWCITSAANEDDANRCCDIVDSDIIAKASVVYNNALSCIFQS